jgi:hypothetical protein
MPTVRLLAALLTASASAAFAAPASYLTLDHSSDLLMDNATAQALWKDNLPAKLSKLYPVSKWGFLSEVEGGFSDAKVCIVTARAMMLPRSGKALLFKPYKTASTFGIQAAASEEQCRALAKAKLGEAIAAVRFALLPI